MQMREILIKGKIEKEEQSNTKKHFDWRSRDVTRIPRGSFIRGRSLSSDSIDIHGKSNMMPIGTCDQYVSDGTVWLFHRVVTHNCTCSIRNSCSRNKKIENNHFFIDIYIEDIGWHPIGIFILQSRDYVLLEACFTKNWRQ